jgi:hypothetical protein
MKTSNYQNSGHTGNGNSLNISKMHAINVIPGNTLLQIHFKFAYILLTRVHMQTTELKTNDHIHTNLKLIPVGITFSCFLFWLIFEMQIKPLTKQWLIW